MDKSAMHTFSYGIYIVSAKSDDGVGACIVNTGVQVTGDPLQVTVAINKQNHTTQIMQKAGHFALSVVTTEADMDFIGRFGFKSSADIDKFEDIETKVSDLGDPYTTLNTCAMVSCTIENTLDLGSHLLFIGRASDAQRLSDAEPLTYAYYHSVLKGKTPPKASSYIASEENTADKTDDQTGGDKKYKFRCTVCGYELEIDEPELPADFVCPICGVGPESFERIN